MQHGHKYSPFFKTTSKAKQPPSPTHPPFVSLLRNNLEQFLNFTLQENQMAGRWARLPKHRRSRPNFWPSLSDRPHQMFILAGRAPNLCHSQNTERAFHFAPANALEDWEPKLSVPQPGWSLCCVVGKQGCNWLIIESVSPGTSGAAGRVNTTFTTMLQSSTATWLVVLVTVFCRVSNGWIKQTGPVIYLIQKRTYYFDSVHVWTWRKKGKHK